MSGNNEANSNSSADADSIEVKNLQTNRTSFQASSTQDPLRIDRDRNLLELALSSVDAGTWDWELETDKITWCPKNFELFGLDPLEVKPTHQDWQNAIEPKDRAKVNDELYQVISGQIAKLKCEFRIIHPKLGVRWLLTLGNATFDRDGKPKRISGITIDITDRKYIEEEALLFQNMTEKLATASEFKTAILYVLHKICEFQNWVFGEAWLPSDKKDVLQLCTTWCNNSSELLSFKETSLNFTFAPNVGLPGRVWTTQKIEWIQDISQVSQDFFLRIEAAQKLGFKTALGVPVISNDRVIAVLVFFSVCENYKTKQMEKLVDMVSKQFGLIIERKQFEAALNSSMATNRALLDAIPNWMFRFSGKNTIVNYKAAKNSLVPLITDDFLNKHISQVLPQEAAKTIIQGITDTLHTQTVQICEYQLTKEGKIKDYEARIAVSSVNEVLAFVRDISQRKQYERNIKFALEQERKLSQLKSRFVFYDIS